MAQRPEHPGLRERKKRATRAKLIEAAAGLVEKQGYAKTTVEQIANTVEVSPRTVAHYFPSKDQLLLSLVDEYAEALSLQLVRVPMEEPALRALLAANLALLDRALTQEGPGGADRIATLLHTLHVSPPLQALSMNLRSPVLVEEIARRMRIEPSDRGVELVFAVWTAVVATSWSSAASMYTAGEVETAELPALLKQGLIATFDVLVTLAD